MTAILTVGILVLIATLFVGVAIGMVARHELNGRSDWSPKAVVRETE